MKSILSVLSTMALFAALSFGQEAPKSCCPDGDCCKSGAACCKKDKAAAKKCCPDGACCKDGACCNKKH
jgi:hypothetical protein